MFYSLTLQSLFVQPPDYWSQIQVEQYRLRSEKIIISIQLVMTSKPLGYHPGIENLVNLVATVRALLSSSR